MADVRVIYGTERSTRTQVINKLIAEQWCHAILLVPTHHHATIRTEEILLNYDMEGVWDRHVLTFPDFVSRLLKNECVEPNLLTDLERSFLFERAIESVCSNEDLDETLRMALKTEGFLSHIERVISQLKQSAVEPYEFRKRVLQRKHSSVIDAIVADVYEAYQQALLDSGSYDGPGLFWEANLKCRESRPEFLDGISTLLLDCFDDFTPSEFRLIRSLERHLETLVFGFSHDFSSERPDLHIIPRRTLDNVRESFSPVMEHVEHSEAHNLIEYVADNIFRREKLSESQEFESNIEIIPCNNYIHEIETIGRRIKSLVLDEGASADDIAVVFRNISEVVGEISSVFGEFGIPFRCISSQQLSDSSVCAFLTNFLDAMQEWKREQVLDVLCSPWIRCALKSPGNAINLYPAISRLAQIISGYSEWDERLSKLIERMENKIGEDVERFCERHPTAIETTRAMLDDVRFLKEVFDSIPEKASIGDFGESVDNLIAVLGLPHALNLPELHHVFDVESKAMDELRNQLGKLRKWDEITSKSQALSEFLTRLRQVLNVTTFKIDGPRHSVMCFDVESVRNLEYSYVFFGGVNQDDVPRIPGVSAIYSEEDIKHLDEVGIPLESKAVHSAKEMLLFHHVLTVPRKKLFVTWHMMSRQGKSKNPSPYLQDLTELACDKTIEHPLPQADSFVPELKYAASWRDIRNHAFLRHPELRKSLLERFETTEHCATIENRRGAFSPFDIYDGVLENSELRDSMATMYGPSHSFSVNQIETYAVCPFSFLVTRLLKIDEAQPPVAEFDARLRGTIMHEVLEAFHRLYKGKALPEIPEDESLERMGMLVEQMFSSKAWLSITAPPGVLLVEKQRLMDIMKRYLLIGRENDDIEWKPRYFEVAFGRTHSEVREEISRIEPFSLTTPSGEVLFAGRIDRVDICGSEARILDYKTTCNIQQKDIIAGRSLQLSVYAIAMQEHLLKDMTCAQAFFVQPGSAKRVETLKRGANKNSWEEREATARDRIGEYVEKIRSGCFPPICSNDSICTYCPGHQACRYDQSRIDRKLEAVEGVSGSTGP